MVADKWLQYTYQPIQGILTPIGRLHVPKGKRFRPRKMAVHVGMARTHYYWRLRKQHSITVRELSRMEDLSVRALNGYISRAVVGAAGR